MAAVALRRNAKSTPGESTHQSWSPNSGSATTGELSNQNWTSNSGQTSQGDTQSLATMLASEHAQQPQLASSLSLTQDHSAHTGPQHQSATSPLDQPQGAPVQYQPSGNDPTPLATETRSQYQPFGNGTSGTTPAQYLSSGEGHTSRNIAEAQLTQLISRDDNAEMPAAPLVHDIATPRRQVGGRCRKWAVSTQKTINKRKCAACCVRDQKFSHGEARLQKWSNRNSQRAYVRAQCVREGVAYDHELHPKQPTDQDAVGSVARQRGCVTQAAADSEILLPHHSKF